MQTSTSTEKTRPFYSEVHRRIPAVHFVSLWRTRASRFASAKEASKFNTRASPSTEGLSGGWTVERGEERRERLKARKTILLLLTSNCCTHSILDSLDANPGLFVCFFFFQVVAYFIRNFDSVRVAALLARVLSEYLARRAGIERIFPTTRARGRRGKRNSL